MAYRSPGSLNLTLKHLEWLLRIGVFGIFLGHGMYAFQVENNWIPYLTFWGLSIEQAQTVMPIIGIVDILVAFLALLRPFKAVLIYATGWAFMTALMRPLTGSEIWAFIERTGNWAVPLALYILLTLNQKPPRTQ